MGNRQERAMLDNTISIYVHWPFCVSKCPYCDFNSHVTNTAVDYERWRLAYRKSLDHYSALLRERVVKSIYFGGGTPSLMPHTLVGDILQALGEKSHIDPDVEITLEVNPTTIELAKFAAFREAGINRVSIGVQSLNNEHLRFLGRAHDSDTAMRAITEAPKIFDRFSFDLMYALPGQTPEQWQGELREALSLASAGHISLYQLMISKGTAFYNRHAAGEFVLPSDDDCAAMYEITANETARFGMHAYELSNYCVPGQESLHNLRYWEYYDYLGIGPGAHSRLRLGSVRVATFCKYNPNLWLRGVEDGDFYSQNELSTKDIINETIIMGLRLKNGIKKARFFQITGQDFESVIGYEKLHLLQDSLHVSGDSVKLREERVFVMDSILSELVL
jgi:putative oxygen-independent coproporphyrinogen III oxidase